MGKVIKDDSMFEAPIELEPGKVQNVRTDNATKSAGPLMREVTKTEWRDEKDGIWFFWYWKPESDAQVSYDCGFSGKLIYKAEKTAA
jgi:hypothetical protein